MKTIKQLLGIVLGGIYGLFCRIFFDEDVFNLGFNIFSISFVWIVPIIIAIIPILFANQELLKSRRKQFFYPLLSEFSFFVFALSSGLEDWLCILIFAFPYLLAAGLIGLGVGSLVKENQSKKMYSIVLLPFLIQPVESMFENTRETYSVSTEVLIQADELEIWSNLVEVPEIKEEEYSPGFFNAIGIPRPIKSELTTIDGIEYRIGYFTENLALFETVASEEYLKKISFDVHIEKSELRNTPTDQHVLNSDFFRFKTIGYKLTKVSDLETLLSLTCEYEINTKMNFYANFWAKRVIADFEYRLLKALKYKFEKHAL